MELFANPRQVRMQTNASRTGWFPYARERRRELGRAAAAGEVLSSFSARPRGNVLHRAHRKDCTSPTKTTGCGVSVTSAPQTHDLRPAREPGPTPCVHSASTSMHINRVLGLGTGAMS
jgi:hypothetical protein